jgi:YVTN family beta-propeller protein
LPIKPSVVVRDQFNNPVTGVSVTFGVTAGGGGITGATSTTDAQGVATVGSWTLGQVAGLNGNALRATASGVPGFVTFFASGVAGAPVRLAFLVPPSRGLAGNRITPAVQVAIQDQFGNTVLPVSDVIHVDLGAVPTPGAKLTGTMNVAAVNGVAVFPDLAIDSAGIGYTLLASTPKIPGNEESVRFDIGGVIGAIAVTRLGPVAGALDVRSKKIYVPGSSLVSVLLDDKELLPQLQGLEAPFGVAANATTNQVYVSSLAGLAVIDGSRTPDALRMVIPVGAGAKGVAVDERTNFIYVAASDPVKGGPALVPVDGSKDLAVLSDVVPLPAAGSGVAFDPRGGFVYVAIPTLQEVVVIDPKPGGARVVIEIRNLGKGTYGVAVDTITNQLFVTNRDDNNVSVINLADFKEVARLPVGRTPEGLGVDAGRGVVYVGNFADGSVSFIDAVKLNLFATLSVGQTPKAAVVDPSTGRVYVPSQLDDVVRVIQP